MARDIRTELESTAILTRSELTHEEYIADLLQYQRFLCNLVLEDDGAERLDEVIVRLERLARERGVADDPKYKKGLYALRRVNKEIAISMSGKIGEERVSRATEFITRRNYKYKNIYVSGDDRETELDHVVLTDSGFIILEVKNVKADITISETGRILYSNEECYHDISICTKMQDKRDLLKASLEKALKERGLDIPIRIDSFIVFSAPKSVYVRITDRCRKEKYCFRGTLPRIVDSYVSDVQYNGEELELLNSLMKEMQTCKKRFAVKLDFIDIRESVAEAILLCMGIPNEEPAKEEDTQTIIDFLPDKSVSDPAKQKRQRNLKIAGTIAGSAASVALFLTGLFASGLVIRRM